MTTSPAKGKRSVIKREGREIISRVYGHLKDEVDFIKATHGKTSELSYLANVRKRTADATGVSEKTVTRILKEKSQLPTASSKFTSPMKKRRRRAKKIEIDCLTADVIRSTIQNILLLNKEVPTLATLKSVLSEKIDFDGCLNTLRVFLLNLGYKWSLTENNRKVLMERADVQLSRFKFLKQMSNYRSDGRPIVYIGESNVLVSNAQSNMWEGNETNINLMKKSGTGHRFIIVHAGTKDGFIPNASLVYTSGEWHYNNAKYGNYTKWCNDNLLPNLPEKSVLVMDNSFYRNVRDSKTPTSFSSKADMKRWLTKNKVCFEDNLHKIELYELIKTHRDDSFISYSTDKAVKSKGFDILRLPPNHPELNAMENILYGIVKNYVASESIEQTSSLKKLIDESIDNVTNTMWLETCQHIEEIENNYMKYFECDLEINVKSESSCDEDSDNLLFDD